MPLTLSTLSFHVFTGAFIGFLCLLLAISMTCDPVRRSRKRRLHRVAHPDGRSSDRGARAGAPSSLRRSEPVPKGLRRIEAFFNRIPALGAARIQARLRRAGLNISITSYFLMISIIATIAYQAVGVAFSTGPAETIAAAAAAGLILPHMIVGFIGWRRSEKFLAGLPDAIDVIVRGIKAGLPVIDSIAVVGEEFSDPIGIEFRAVRDKVRLGESIDRALAEMAERIGKPEVSFLSTSIAVQRETGGNLSVALENLSTTLRDRRQMKLKIKALSSEARASAYILGSMPFIMGAIIYLLNPNYIMPLFTDERGQNLVYIGLASIGFGIVVMARMIRFKI
ncbi:type II secretion system F family protein [Fodinicurvata sp. EGI_FJ10296]|uniref:type II secretion system F family protein n=1 Tax=Fodinicurvata sp. EGI_FJ10296 TaxID=3231908 RepID=UPI0034551193